MRHKKKILYKKPKQYHDLHKNFIYIKYIFIIIGLFAFICRKLFLFLYKPKGKRYYMIDRSSEPALADSNTSARGSKWTVLFRSNNLVDN